MVTSLPTCNQVLVWKVGRPAPWHHWQELHGVPVSMFSHCLVGHLCKQRNKTHLFSSGSWNVIHHEPRWTCFLHYLAGYCLLRDTGQLWVTQDEQCHLNWDMCAKELSDELIECWKMLPDFLNYENLVKFEFQINHREFLQITMSRYNPGNVGLNKKLNIKKKEDFGVVFFFLEKKHSLFKNICCLSNYTFNQGILYFSCQF